MSESGMLVVGVVCALASGSDAREAAGAPGLALAVTADWKVIVIACAGSVLLGVLVAFMLMRGKSESRPKRKGRKGKAEQRMAESFETEYPVQVGQPAAGAPASTPVIASSVVPPSAPAATPTGAPTSAPMVVPVVVEPQQSKPRQDVRVGKLHGQGRRTEQQDTFGVSDQDLEHSRGRLIVVCDGMGGLSNGGAVSSVAVHTIMDRFLMLNQATDPLHALMSLAIDANVSVNNYLGPNGIKSSGCTLVMALVRNGYLSFLSIGDSRIYLYRAGTIIQLNREHDYGRELVVKAVNGDMTLFDALNDSQANRLASYLGEGRISCIDFPSNAVRLFPGDKVILMTDGVYNALTDEEMAAALQSDTAQAVADTFGALIERKAYEQQDNFTAVVYAPTFEAGGKDEPTGLMRVKGTSDELSEARERNGQRYETQEIS